MKKHPEVAGRLNQAGNALAYGHPYGASGAEIMIHLMEILREKEGRLGAAAIPAAGGVGEAILDKAHGGGRMKLSDYVIRWGKDRPDHAFLSLDGKRSLMEKRMLLQKEKGNLCLKKCTGRSLHST